MPAQSSQFVTLVLAEADPANNAQTTQLITQALAGLIAPNTQTTQIVVQALVNEPADFVQTSQIAVLALAERATPGGGGSEPTDPTPGDNDMACEIGTEYQDIVEARTYSQFNQSTFEDMCRIAAEELDVEYAPVVCNLRNLINFDTLGGVWLELLGRILGIARGLSVEQQDELFALSDYAGTVVTGSPLGGFDADNVTNMAGVLRSFNSLDTGLESDVQYVQNVRAKALLFSADPTVDDIAEFAEAITGKTANVDVSVNFTVTVTGSPEAFTAFEREVLTNLIPVAAGVNLGVS